MSATAASLSMRRRLGPGIAIPRVHRDARWLLDLLTRVSPEPSNTTAPATKPAPAYLAVPRAAWPVVLVPDAPLAAIAGSLRNYRALRPSGRRVVRSLILAGMRHPPLRRHISERIDLVTTDAAGIQGLAHLAEHVSELLGESALLSVAVRPVAPNRKPVLHAVAEDGRTLGFVKVGWNDFTRRAIRVEAEGLHRCASAETSVRAPALVHHAAWHDLELLVTAPMPPDVTRYQPRTVAPPSDVLWALARLGDHHCARLGESQYAKELPDRLTVLHEIDLPGASEATRAVDELRDRFGGVVMDFGAWHGDCVPWNLARRADDVVLWDWEHYGDHVPVGFDLFHFHFEVARVVRRRSAADAFRIATDASFRAAREHDAATGPVHLVGALYLAEALVRYATARQVGASVDRRFHAGVIRLLADAAGSGRAER